MLQQQMTAICVCVLKRKFFVESKNT